MTFIRTDVSGASLPSLTLPGGEWVPLSARPSTFCGCGLPPSTLVVSERSQTASTNIDTRSTWDDKPHSVEPEQEADISAAAQPAEQDANGPSVSESDNWWEREPPEDDWDAEPPFDDWHMEPPDEHEPASNPDTLPVEPLPTPSPADPEPGGDGFVHLHVHSDLSALDGMPSPEKLAARAGELGMKAMAITDHGALGGCFRFAKACRKHGVKPLLGIEAYAAIGSRFDPQTVKVRSDEATDADGDVDAGWKTKAYDHLILIAATAQGWRNLVAIHNASWDTVKRKPLIDLDLLAEHREGIIVLTGCVGGMVAGPLARAAETRRRAGARSDDGEADDVVKAEASARADEELARANLRRLIDATEPGRLFIEVMDHGVGAELAGFDGLVRLAIDSGLPLVATNDIHYLDEGDAAAHEVMLAMQSKATLDDPKRFRFNGEGYFVRTGEQMLALRPDSVPWRLAVANTARVADMVDDWVLPEPSSHLPSPPPLTEGTVWWANAHRGALGLNEPSEMSAAVEVRDDPRMPGNTRVLLHLCSKGIQSRYGDHRGVPTKVHRRVCERLAQELRVVSDAGFTDYFLIVADLIAFARSKGVLVGPGRGSAGGSIIAYLSGITDVDPLEGGLLFERFLEPGREGFPDIDIDIEKTSAPMLYEYLENTYGQGTLARCGTLQYERSKRILKDTGRVLGLSPSLCDELAKTVPVDAGKPAPLRKLLDPSDPLGESFRRVLGKTEDVSKGMSETLSRVASQLEGVSSGVSIHACGIILADTPLAQLLPLRKDPETGMRVTEWEYPDLESIGFLKLDLLRLRNLDVLHKCADFVEQTEGTRPDVARLPEPGGPEWASAMSPYREGNLSGVFQMESSGMRAVAMGVAPDKLADVSDIVALYRPGTLGSNAHERYIARRCGFEPVSYKAWTDDPDEIALLDPILGPTEGIILYQEQLMQLGKVVAGFDVSERSRLRHAVGKKKLDEMAEVGQMFVERAQVGRGTAERLWDVMKDSGKYSFNKSHSWAYATLSVLTARAKTQWPACYAAALLATTDKPDKRVLVLEAIRREGVAILPPDINGSDVGTAPARVEGGLAIRFGLSEVNGVGSAAASIVAERDSGGPFLSLADAMARLPKKLVTVQAWRSLICAGAFDQFGSRFGQMQVVAARGENPTDAEWGSVERCQMQRAVLRTVVDPSPFRTEDHTREMMSWTTPYGSRPATVAKVLALNPGDAAQSVVFAGMIGRADIIESARGPMLSFTVEGVGDHVEAVMWSDALRRQETQGRLPVPGDLVAVEGTVKTRVFEATESDPDDPDSEITVTRTQTQVTARRLYPVLLSDDSRPPSPEPLPWTSDQKPDGGHMTEPVMVFQPNSSSLAPPAPPSAGELVPLAVGEPVPSQRASPPDPVLGAPANASLGPCAAVVPAPAQLFVASARVRSRW